jgi:hypothetical protein
MKTITLEIEDEKDAHLLLELAQRLNLKVMQKANMPSQQDYVQQLLNNPMKASDFTPLKRDEIYE